jgi:hypothetical protein
VHLRKLVELCTGLQNAIVLVVTSCVERRWQRRVRQIVTPRQRARKPTDRSLLAERSIDIIKDDGK